MRAERDDGGYAVAEIGGDGVKRLTKEEQENLQVWKDGNLVNMDFYYPRTKDAVDTFEVGMTDVRATDSIRIKYDFPRDGWVIYQPKTTIIRVSEDILKEETEWIESAFCPSWNFEEEDDE